MMSYISMYVVQHDCPCFCGKDAIILVSLIELGLL